MTYQSDFARNKYAQMACDIGWKHKLTAPQMHALAARLCESEDRAKHDQHLQQIGVAFAKEMKQ